MHSVLRDTCVLSPIIREMKVAHENESWSRDGAKSVILSAPYGSLSFTGDISSQARFLDCRRNKKISVTSARSAD